LNYCEKNPLVSIITPIYNGGAFIDKCFQCIKAQHYSAIEWVVVNDGSDDNTLEKLLKMQTIDSSIIVIDQENSGAAEARRHAATKASGEYVVYLDIDDTISNDAIDSAMQKFSDEIDIVLFTKIIVGDNCNTSDLIFKDNHIQSGLSVFEGCIDGWHAHSFGVYRRSLFLSCYQYLDEFFAGEKTFKDEFLTRIIFSQARLISYCDGEYYYDLSDSSVSKKFNSQYFEISQHAYSLEKFINYKGLHTKIERLYARLFFDILARYVRWRKNIHNDRDWFDALSKLARHVELGKDVKRCLQQSKYAAIVPRLIVIFIFKCI
jgi:glycosyltransferase involved in cell wall biosynthesis